MAKHRQKVYGYYVSELVIRPFLQHARICEDIDEGLLEAVRQHDNGERFNWVIPAGQVQKYYESRPYLPPQIIHEKLIDLGIVSDEPVQLSFYRDRNRETVAI